MKKERLKISELNEVLSSTDKIHQAISAYNIGIFNIVEIKNAEIQMDRTLSGNFENIHFIDCNINGERGINFADLNVDLLTFDNCSFLHTVQLETFSGALYVNNCKFHTFFEIKNISTDKIFKIQNSIFDEKVNISESINFRGFEIEGNKFHENVTFQGEKIEFITLKKNDFFGKLILGNPVYSMYYPQSKGKTEIDRINIDSGDFYSDLIINDLIVNHRIWLVNSEINIQTLKVRSSIFNNKFAIAHCKINTVIIYGGIFKDSFITNFAKIDDLYISGGNFQSILIKEGSLNKLDITDNHEVDNLGFSEKSLTISELIIQQANPVKINIRKNPIKDSSLTLKSLVFKDFIFHNNSAIRVYDLDIQRAYFNYFINLGNIYFTNVLVGNKNTVEEAEENQDAGKHSGLIILNSDLGKTSFINCKNSADNPSFYFGESNMSSAYFTNEQILLNPTFIESESLDKFRVIDSGIVQLQQKEGLYNQLKKLHENSGDLITALSYRAKSYKVRRKIIFEKLKNRQSFYSKKGRNNNEYFRDLYDYIVLTINQWSNNHGVSWKRAFLFLVIFTGGLYYRYCYLSGLRLGSWSNLEERALFWEVVSYMGDFLTPLSKEDTYLKFYPEQMASSISFPKARIFGQFSRIVIAFFIYQLIQAFRKLGKK